MSTLQLPFISSTRDAMAHGSPTRRRRKDLSSTINHMPDHDGNQNEQERQVLLGSSPVRESSHSKQRQGKKRSRRKNHEDESFLVLFLQVGASLACICLTFVGVYRTLNYGYGLVYPSVSEPETIDFDDDTFTEINVQQPVSQPQQQDFLQPYNPELDKLLLEAARELMQEQEVEQQPRTSPPAQAIPRLNVSDWFSRFDVYGLADRYSQQQMERSNNSNVFNHSHQQLTTFWRASAGLREEFAERYGGENAARYILEQGLDRFIGNISSTSDSFIPSTLQNTACRILRAQAEDRPFRFVFGGYSVTNGRGNYFSQSYPFFMEKLLHTPFQLLGIQLKVTNHAIGGCPSLPYGWCLGEFMGYNADAISWDFSMNEAGGDPAGLEAYIRLILTQLPQQPMLLVKDTPMATQRRALLREYQSLLKDPLLIVTDAAADFFLEQLSSNQRPLGFTDWRKFGAPAGAPGQVVHHPGVKEHEFIGWILAMHFLSILELVAGAGASLRCPERKLEPLFLPKPMAVDAVAAANATKPWESLYYGLSNMDDGKAPWAMNRINCRTTFEPVVSGELSELIVVGSVGENVDVMLPKSNMFYNRGWVLDMSDREKKAKRKLELFDGLGFIDSKKAYYGLYTSKALRLLLPYTGNLSPKAGDSASKYFRSVVVCEVNEKRDYGACDASNDVSFVVGGVNTSATLLEKTSFMGKKVCVYLPVSDSAVLSTRALVKQQYAHPSGLLPPEETEEEIVRGAKVGLELQVKVINRRIMSTDKACSISHVIWEEA